MRLQVFELQGHRHAVEYVETSTVTSGVTCDVYRFTADDTRDLGVVQVQPGCRTPMQRVVGGTSTIEGLLRGQGTLTVTKPDGRADTHAFDDPRTPPVSVDRGDIMQWHADGPMPLIFYEVCSPPYEAGRFEDLDDGADPDDSITDIAE